MHKENSIVGQLPQLPLKREAKLLCCFAPVTTTLQQYEANPCIYADVTLWERTIASRYRNICGAARGNVILSSFKNLNYPYFTSIILIVLYFI